MWTVCTWSVTTLWPLTHHHVGQGHQLAHLQPSQPLHSIQTLHLPPPHAPPLPSHQHPPHSRPDQPPLHLPGGPPTSQAGPRSPHGPGHVSSALRRLLGPVQHPQVPADGDRGARGVSYCLLIRLTDSAGQNVGGGPHLTQAQHGPRLRHPLQHLHHRPLAHHRLDHPHHDLYQEVWDLSSRHK